MGCGFHQTDSLAFRPHAAKELRMVCLRHRQIEIAFKLLPAVIVVGMDHTGAGSISHCVVILQKGLSRKNHILIKNRPADKAALKPEFLPVISAAHIRGKKGLDSHLLQICLVFTQLSSG